MTAADPVRTQAERELRKATRKLDKARWQWEDAILVLSKTGASLREIALVAGVSHAKVALVIESRRALLAALDDDEPPPSA
jgi:hypothetical protein